MMIRDTFYFNAKPNVHPREKFASSIEDARNQCTTEHFWIINEFCDYTNFDWDFDFEFLPDEDVWAEAHNNVWPSQHQKDSGTWLCPKEHSNVIIYRADVNPIIRKNIKTDNWNEIEKVKDFDFSWHPDPTDPPYIYVWGCKYYPLLNKHILEYRVNGATDIKYMPTLVELEPQWDRWKEIQKIDPKTKFDLSWRPGLYEPPYIYVWGNKYDSAEVNPTLEYHVPGATDKKYMPELIELKPLWDRWEIDFNSVDTDKFDFTWRPPEHDPPYIYRWGCKYFPVEVQHFIEYKVPGATEIKYIQEPIDLIFEHDKWEADEFVDLSNFDLNWRPDPREPAYIYVWGCKYFPVEVQHVLEYTVPGAIEIKYMDQIVDLLPTNNWKEYNLVDKSKFDMSWRPDPREPAFIYVWGNKYDSAETKPTLEYYVPGATDKKYMSEILELEPEWDRWTLSEQVSKSKFDFSWRPDPREPPYIYRWGCKYYPVEVQHVLEYKVPGAIEIKYMDQIIELEPSISWKEYKLVDKSKFDMSWRPDPREPAYIYVWGNKYEPGEMSPTIEYVCEGATERKYVGNAEVLPQYDRWSNISQLDKSSFDFTWRPDPKDPPYVYQFCTVIDDIWIENGPTYTTPNNDGTIVKLDLKLIKPNNIQYPKYYIKTTLDDLVKEHPTEMFWALNKIINYDNFKHFAWQPTKENLFNVTVFGSNESELTHTYFVNAPQYLLGNNDFNFIENQTAKDNKYLSNLFNKLDMVYVDRGNSESTERFLSLQQRFPMIQKTRYLNTWVDTITRFCNKSSTEIFWVLDSNLDYSEFDFDYYPNPWQMKMVHVFGTQWSHWGTTFIINKESFPIDTKYIKIIEHLSTINFVKNKKAKITKSLYDIVFIDHGNNYEFPKDCLIVKYENNYLTTLKNIVTKLPNKKEHFVWICSSICEYSTFDFSYICDPYAKDQLHVFPSNEQKFGDTFLLDVNKARETLNELESLTDYTKINFNRTLKANRLPEPKLIVNEDTHVNAVHQINGDFPYTTLIHSDNLHLDKLFSEPMNLWNTNKNIIVHSTGATKITVPSNAKHNIKKELYDYPHIIKNAALHQSSPMDIVFLSNGESCSDNNYERLLKVTHGLKNRVVRVDGINGRVNAYHAALEASNTPWAFTIFAKLEVNEKFDFNFTPDMMQVPKHYIFYAKNPVNGLIYGHQGAILYNKKLTLSNNGDKGLDFTLDDEHEVVERLSGTAHYNTDAYSTWRAAFRECIKLKSDETNNVSAYRLNIWLTKAHGDFSEYSIKGAQDAVKYYEEVNGDYDALKLSYEWSWLATKFNSTLNTIS